MFAPPQLPTPPSDSFEDNFVTDESTFTPPEEPEIPEIPIVTLPDATGSSVVEDTLEQAVSQEKERNKMPAMPDGDPIDDGNTDSMAEMQMGAKKLVATLESFKIKAEVTNICRGPSVTRYELVPDAGVRINKITTLSDDIAMRLAATSVRIEAPIPGKSAIGIEVPNSAKSMVTMREIIDTPQFRDAKSKLNVALGKDITGNIVCADLAKMPHLLVAGTTGSGKSVCLNSMIVSC